jgi:albonoursin synthase
LSDIKLLKKKSTFFLERRIMEVLEAIHTRHSTRLFSQDPIPVDTLKQLIEAAINAPTASNAQNWVFGIVTEPLKIISLRSLSPGLIGYPAAMIIFCIRTGKNPQNVEPQIPEYTWMGIGSALQNCLLMAHSLGIGSRPIGSFHKKGVSIYLNLPENILPVLIVALGESIDKKIKSRATMIEPVCFWEEWDES